MGGARLLRSGHDAGLQKEKAGMLQPFDGLAQRASLDRPAGVWILLATEACDFAVSAKQLGDEPVIILDPQTDVPRQTPSDINLELAHRISSSLRCDSALASFETYPLGWVKRRAVPFRRLVVSLGSLQL